jgi:GLPGLI family protein
MKTKIFLGLFTISLLLSVKKDASIVWKDDFYAKAVYITKQKMELGNWGNRLSEAQKKQVAERLKNRLEKTYILSFNKTTSNFYEEEKIDALSGATDSWGKNFTPGEQFKNIKTKELTQNQELYGKRFLVKDSLIALDWKLTGETKNIGKYVVSKAVTMIPKKDLKWYDFSWDMLKQADKPVEEQTLSLVEVEAWYTMQVPVSHGPMEYWGLPGLILEVSAENTTVLCSKLVINPKDTVEIEAPKKGTEVNKTEYRAIVMKKMKEFRANRMGRGR